MSVYRPKHRNVWIGELNRGNQKFSKTFKTREEAMEYEKYLFNTLPPPLKIGKATSQKLGPPVHSLHSNGCILVRSEDGRCEMNMECKHYDACLNLVCSKTTWPGWVTK